MKEWLFCVLTFSDFVHSTAKALTLFPPRVDGGRGKGREVVIGMPLINDCVDPIPNPPSRRRKREGGCDRCASN